MKITELLMHLLTLLSLASSALGGPVLAKRVPLLPADDPFYTPPAGFESAAPGTILKQRPITAAFFGLIPNPVQAFQLLFRTTATNGSAIAAVTTIFKGSNASPDRFVSFQAAYDSAATKCNPSYTFQFLASQTNLLTSIEMNFLQGLVSSGYIVSAPDYEGPDAAFYGGRLAGMVILDSMRAVSGFSNLSFTTQTPAIAGIGYSGGAIATGWAASLQNKYAPQLPIKGWTAGGTPANLTGTLLDIDSTLFSGFQPVGFAGLAKPSAYGARLQPILDSILTPRGRSVYDFANNNCAVSDIINFAFQSFFSTEIQTLGSNLLYEPTVADILTQNTMGIYANETPIAPVYVYHASQDEGVPYSDIVKTVNSWCANGASIKFTTFAAGEHFTTEILGFPAVLSYVATAFAGTIPPGCSNSTVLDNALSPDALGANLEPITNQLIDALALIGQGDQNVAGNLTILEDTIQ